MQAEGTTPRAARQRLWPPDENATKRSWSDPPRPLRSAMRSRLPALAARPVPALFSAAGEASRMAAAGPAAHRRTPRAGPRASVHRRRRHIGSGGAASSRRAPRGAPASRRVPTRGRRTEPPTARYARARRARCGAFRAHGETTRGGGPARRRSLGGPSAPTRDRCAPSRERAPALRRGRHTARARPYRTSPRMSRARRCSRAPRTDGASRRVLRTSSAETPRAAAPAERRRSGRTARSPSRAAPRRGSFAAAELLRAEAELLDPAPDGGAVLAQLARDVGDVALVAPQQLLQLRRRRRRAGGAARAGCGGRGQHARDRFGQIA